MKLSSCLFAVTAALYCQESLPRKCEVLRADTSVLTQHEESWGAFFFPELLRLFPRLGLTSIFSDIGSEYKVSIAIIIPLKPVFNREFGMGTIPIVVDLETGYCE